ncbi:MAG TPA: branched-chain amino acid aminotransferase [Pseudolabrys sp.]|jgi:branched-chain amino acid aminotransferase|nr:branched-chain amino acid aminotransferase [Pseudolabrys sp.]
MAAGTGWSKTWTFYEGDWHEGNIPIMGVRSHAAWLGSSVFDGARTFEGVTPDLDLHCARVNTSAEAMHLHPAVSAEEWQALTQDGIKRFDPGTALYIRPLYWAEQSGNLLVAPDPESTRWALTLYEAPMRTPDGFSITLSPFRKPSIETMPTDAKAGCLYPNNARALIEAQRRGFGNCVVLDMLGNVAELATANLFIGKDGVVLTPAPNGTFLNGITRQRVIKLLRDAGVSVVETTLRYGDLLEADEIFSSGNYSKVMPVNRIDDRSLQPGPLYWQARDLYWAYAHS